MKMRYLVGCPVIILIFSILIVRNYLDELASPGLLVNPPWGVQRMNLLMWLIAILLFMHYSTDIFEEEGNQNSSDGWVCVSFVLVIICLGLLGGWRSLPAGTLVIFTAMAYYCRRIGRRRESASTMVGESGNPTPSPDTPEEHSNQDSSVNLHNSEEYGNQGSSPPWYSIYFILVILIGIGWLLFRP